MCLKLCKTFKIRTKDGKEIILRRPRITDAKQLLYYINSLVEEDAMILVNKKKSLREEKQWLKDHINQIKRNKLHHLVAEYNGKIIGNVEIIKGRERKSHIAEYGVSVHKDHRNLGIGKQMSKIILDIAKKDKDIKIVYASVLKINKLAIEIYKKLGFRKVAVLPKRFKYKGKYVDELVMDFHFKR